MGCVNTGEIASMDHFRSVLSEEQIEKFVKPLQTENLPAHALAAFAKTGRAKIGRNDPCFCGSGKKFKQCCMELPRPVRPETPAANSAAPRCPVTA
jgi:uncharacterized protein YecA (UPF0149 family)